ncbi:YopX family protein [Fusobacterium vincentii]|uniref:YopX family protein n=1 Tax=Fusobacterium vincentii TaxID=155615 RepID=UPI002B2C1D9F|nr:YopX family protein [Fusobacterium vincentii]
MREIKFRAWIKELNEIREVEYINFWKKMISFPNKFCKEYYLNADFDEIELMQYTGLKDIRGKEIYEGDIVTLHNSRYKVIFNTEEARFVLRDDEFEMNIPFTNNNNERMEIIGNIYENPELLGEQ